MLLLLIQAMCLIGQIILLRRSRIENRKFYEILSNMKQVSKINQDFLEVLAKSSIGN